MPAGLRFMFPYNWQWIDLHCKSTDWFLYDRNTGINLGLVNICKKFSTLNTLDQWVEFVQCQKERHDKDISETKLSISEIFSKIILVVVFDWSRNLNVFWKIILLKYQINFQKQWQGSTYLFEVLSWKFILSQPYVEWIKMKAYTVA